MALSDAPSLRESREPKPDHPPYVMEALRGLTKTQAKYILAGCLHGDVTMGTVRALKGKALFYLKITSPNGRCGHMVLTPLGETVRAVLRARESARKDGSSPQDSDVSQ